MRGSTMTVVVTTASWSLIRVRSLRIACVLEYELVM